jgi:hypothetical protein
MNNGSEDIKSLMVPGPTANIEAARVEFGDVPAGELTEHRNIPSGVYRYAAYEYTLDRINFLRSIVENTETTATR